jgi:hypothetical protein
MTGSFWIANDGNEPIFINKQIFIIATTGSYAYSATSDNWWGNGPLVPNNTDD